MFRHEIVFIFDRFHFGSESGKSSGDISLFGETLDGLPISQQLLGEGRVVGVRN
jgi:hypothetical protein